MHRVLHAPDVVPGTVRGELLPYDARVRPGLGTRTRGCALCCGEEIGGFGGCDEPMDDDVAMAVVVFFERGGGNVHGG